MPQYAKFELPRYNCSPVRLKVIFGRHFGRHIGFKMAIVRCDPHYPLSCITMHQYAKFELPTYNGTPVRPKK